MREFGPAIYLETTRFEAVHKIFKDRMRESHNFVNVPLTIANHYAFIFNYEVQYGEEEQKNYLKYETEGLQAVDDCNLGRVLFGTRIKFNGIEYQTGMIICTSITDLKNGGYPTFGIINALLISNDALYFKTTPLLTKFYSFNYAGYNVHALNDVEESICLTTLPSPYPLALWKTCNENIEKELNFVSLKTIEFT